MLGSFELDLIEQIGADPHCKACLIVTGVWIVWVHCDTSLWHQYDTKNNISKCSDNTDTVGAFSVREESMIYDIYFSICGKEYLLQAKNSLFRNEIKLFLKEDYFVRPIESQIRVKKLTWLDELRLSWELHQMSKKGRKQRGKRRSNSI